MTDDGPVGNPTATPTGTLTPIPTRPAFATVTPSPSPTNTPEATAEAAATGGSSNGDDDGGTSLDGLEGFGIAVGAGAAVFALAIVAGIFVARRRPAIDEEGEYE